MVLISSANASRESRHVAVYGLPSTLSQDKIHLFFSEYGRVQKVERNNQDGSFIVSFMDVRSAQKAQTGENRLETNPFRITFYEPDVKTGGIPTNPPSSSSPSFSLKSSSPKLREPLALLDRPSSSFSSGPVITINIPQRPLGRRLPSKESVHRDVKNQQQNVTESLTSSETEAAQQINQKSQLHAVIVDNLPYRSEATLKEHIREHFKRFGKGLQEIVIENDGDLQKRAICWFQRIKIDELTAEQNITILGQRVQLRVAPYTGATPSSTNNLTQDVRCSVPPSPSSHTGIPTPSSSSSSSSLISKRNSEEVDVFHPKSSRTLYVGSLETRVTDESLRRRFSKYGEILDVDVKNCETKSPFAFLQFADIESSVKAINANLGNANKKGRPNFGRSMPTNKLWIGHLPEKATSDYITQKLKTLSDSITDLLVDMREREAIVIFTSQEAATQVYNRIRASGPKTFNFKFAEGDYRVAADYCSDRLHDYFVDRKHQSSRPDEATTSGESAAIQPPPPFPALNIVESTSSPLLATVSSTAGGAGLILAPPPDPPSEMPAFISGNSSRYRHGSPTPSSSSSGMFLNSSNRRRADSRDRERDRDRQRGYSGSSRSRYDRNEKNDNKKKDRKKRSRIPSSSSASSDSTSKSSSSNSSPKRKESQRSPRRIHGSSTSKIKASSSSSSAKYSGKSERRNSVVRESLSVKTLVGKSRDRQESPDEFEASTSNTMSPISKPKLQIKINSNPHQSFQQQHHQTEKEKLTETGFCFSTNGGPLDPPPIPPTIDNLQILSPNQHCNYHQRASHINQPQLQQQQQHLHTRKLAAASLSSPRIILTNSPPSSTKLQQTTQLVCPTTIDQKLTIAPSSHTKKSIIYSKNLPVMIRVGVGKEPERGEEQENQNENLEKLNHNRPTDPRLNQPIKPPYICLNYFAYYSNSSSEKKKNDEQNDNGAKVVSQSLKRLSDHQTKPESTRYQTSVESTTSVGQTTRSSKLSNRKVLYQSQNGGNVGSKKKAKSLNDDQKLGNSDDDSFSDIEKYPPPPASSIDLIAEPFIVSKVIDKVEMQKRFDNLGVKLRNSVMSVTNGPLDLTGEPSLPGSIDDSTNETIEEAEVIQHSSTATNEKTIRDPNYVTSRLKYLEKERHMNEFADFVPAGITTRPRASFEESVRHQKLSSASSIESHQLPIVASSTHFDNAPKVSPSTIASITSPSLSIAIPAPPVTAGGHQTPKHSTVGYPMPSPVGVSSRHSSFSSSRAGIIPTICTGQRHSTNSIVFPPNLSVPPPSTPASTTVGTAHLNQPPLSGVDMMHSPILTAPPPAPCLAPVSAVPPPSMATVSTHQPIKKSSLTTPVNTPLTTPTTVRRDSGGGIGTPPVIAALKSPPLFNSRIPPPPVLTNITATNSGNVAGLSTPQVTLSFGEVSNHPNNSNHPTTPKSHHVATPKTVSRPTIVPEKIVSRHDSISKPTQSTTASALSNRSHSVSEAFRKASVSKDPGTDLIDKVLNNSPSVLDIKKLPRIEKKSSASTSSAPNVLPVSTSSLTPSSKEKEREKEKEKKRKEKEKESLKKGKRREEETKEERAKRKELERAQKEKEEKKEKQKVKEKARKEKEKKKLLEKKKSSSGKRKKGSDSEESEDDDSDFDLDSRRKSEKAMTQEEKDHRLALILSGGGIYDNVKLRRKKADQKTNKSLEKIRQKNNSKPKRRIHIESSESESDSNQNSDQEDDVELKMRKEEKNVSTTETEETGGDIIKKMRKKKSKKEGHQKKETLSPDEGPGSDSEEKEKKKKKKVSKEERKRKRSSNQYSSDDANQGSQKSRVKKSKKNVENDDEVFKFMAKYNEQKKNKEVIEKKKKRSREEVETENEVPSKRNHKEVENVILSSAEVAPEVHDKKLENASVSSKEKTDEKMINAIPEGESVSTSSKETAGMSTPLVEETPLSTVMQSPQQRYRTLSSASTSSTIASRNETLVDVRHSAADEEKEQQHPVQKPRLLTKAALKSFDSSPASQTMVDPLSVGAPSTSTSQSLQALVLSTDSSDDSSSSSPSSLTSDDDEVVVDKSKIENVKKLNEPSKRVAVTEVSQINKNSPMSYDSEHNGIESDHRKVTSESAAMSLISDKETADAVQSIFDEEDMLEPQYPSHDFIAADPASTLSPSSSSSLQPSTPQRFLSTPAGVSSENDATPKTANLPINVDSIAISSASSVASLESKKDASAITPSKSAGRSEITDEQILEEIYCEEPVVEEEEVSENDTQVDSEINQERPAKTPISTSKKLPIGKEKVDQSSISPAQKSIPITLPQSENETKMSSKVMIPQPSSTPVVILPTTQQKHNLDLQALSQAGNKLKEEQSAMKLTKTPIQVPTIPKSTQVPIEVPIETSSKTTIQTPTTKTPIHKPTVHASTVQASTPRVQASTPNVQASTPTVQAPEVQAPTVQAPTVQAPAVQAPAVQAPTVHAPAVPASTVHAPTVHAPTVQAPTVHAPAVQASTVHAPTVHAPTVQAPTVHAPTVQAPTVQAPTVQAPTVHAPTVQVLRVKSPTVQAPTVKVSTAQTPGVQKPMLQMPTIQTSIQTPVQTPLPTPTVKTPIPTPTVQTSIPTPTVQTSIPTPTVQTPIPTPTVQMPKVPKPILATTVQSPIIPTPIVQTPILKTPKAVHPKTSMSKVIPPQVSTPVSINTVTPPIAQPLLATTSTGIPTTSQHHPISVQSQLFWPMQHQQPNSSAHSFPTNIIANGNVNIQRTANSIPVVSPISRNTSQSSASAVPTTSSLPISLQQFSTTSQTEMMKVFNELISNETAKREREEQEKKEIKEKEEREKEKKEKEKREKEKKEREFREQQMQHQQHQQHQQQDNGLRTLVNWFSQMQHTPMSEEVIKNMMHLTQQQAQALQQQIQQQQQQAQAHQQQQIQQQAQAHQKQVQQHHQQMQAHQQQQAQAHQQQVQQQAQAHQQQVQHQQAQAHQQQLQQQQAQHQQVHQLESSTSAEVHHQQQLLEIQQLQQQQDQSLQRVVINGISHFAQKKGLGRCHEGEINKITFLEYFPQVWNGTLSMKSWETTISLYFVSGNRDALEAVLGFDESKRDTIKINQRLRMDNSQMGHVTRLLTENEFTCCIATATAMDTTLLHENVVKFQTNFIDYLVTKSIAGISTLEECEGKWKGGRIHVMPPCEIVTRYMSDLAPNLCNYLTKKACKFLLLVFSSSESIEGSTQP